MDIFKAYDAYQGIKKPIDKFNKYVNTGKSALSFALNRNAENFLNLLNNLKGFININPLAKIFLSYYDVHLQLIAKVIDAYEQNNTQLESDLDAISKELEKFRSKSGIILEDSTFDEKELQSGPFFYLAHLQKINPTTSMDKLSNEVRGVCSIVTQMIIYLDELLFHYTKMWENYEKFYKLASKIHNDRIANSIGFNKVFSGLTLHRLELDYTFLITGDLNKKINELNEQRNKWADWLGIAKKHKAEYLNVQ